MRKHLNENGKSIVRQGCGLLLPGVRTWRQRKAYAMADLAIRTQASIGRSVSTIAFGNDISSNLALTCRYKLKLRFAAGCAGCPASRCLAVSSLQTHSKIRQG